MTQLEKTSDGAFVSELAPLASADLAKKRRNIDWKGFAGWYLVVTDRKRVEENGALTE